MRVPTTRYTVLRILGRMPVVPRMKLDSVLSSSQLTWGRPRTKIYPMMKTSRAQVRAAQK